MKINEIKSVNQAPLDIKEVFRELLEKCDNPTYETELPFDDIAAIELDGILTGATGIYNLVCGGYVETGYYARATDGDYMFILRTYRELTFKAYAFRLIPADDDGGGADD